MKGSSARVTVDRPVYRLGQLRSTATAKEEEDDNHDALCCSPSSLRRRCGGSQSPKSLLKTLLPIVDWMGNYKFREDLLADIVAGFTVAIMHIPQGMAYATLAELDPIYGIYTAIFPVIIYILLGPSRHVSMGTNPLTSILVGSVEGRYAAVGLAAHGQPDVISERSGDAAIPVNGQELFSRMELMTALALLVGIWQAAFAFLRLGKLSWILSEVLVSGYTTAAAVHVLASQLKSILGISLSSHSGPLKLINIAIELSHKISAINWAAFIISLACIAILVLNNELFKPELAKHCSFPMPIQLIVVIIGTLLSHQFNFEGQYGISVVGELPTGFPKPSVPNVSVFPKILPESLIIAVVGYSITLSMAKIFAAKFNYRVDGNQEMFSEGLSNIFGSFFSSMPAGASMSRSAVQVSVGGRSQLTSAVSVACLSAVILFAGPLFAALPKAVLSSIIVVALKGMLLQYHDFNKFWAKSKLDGVLWLSTLIAVLVLDVDSGLVVGIVLNLVLLVYRSLKVRLAEVTEVADTGLFVENASGKELEKAIVTLRLGGALTFGSFEVAMEEVNKNTSKTSTTILDLSAVPFVDQSGAKALKSWADKGNEVEGTKERSRYLAGPTAKVEDMLAKFGTDGEVVFASVLDAVRYCQHKGAASLSGLTNEAFARSEVEAEEGGARRRSVSGENNDDEEEEGVDSGISRSGSPNDKDAAKNSGDSTQL